MAISQSLSFAPQKTIKIHSGSDRHRCERIHHETVRSRNRAIQVRPSWNPVKTAGEARSIDFAARRHHLIEEAKAELDIAYEEVKRAEQEMMACEAEYFAKSKHLDGSADALQVLINEKETRQKRCGIAQLYELQRNAIQRFSEISSVFTIVNSAESPAAATDLIRQHLFRADGPILWKAAASRTTAKFVKRGT